MRKPGGVSLLVFIGFCAVLVPTTSLRAADDDGAKGIKFYDAVKIFRHQQPAAANKPKVDAPEPAAPKPSEQVGVKYQIKLTRENQVAMVPSTFHFMDGDIIHLQCDLNDESYVYILQRTLLNRADGAKGMTSTPAGARKATPYKLLYPIGDAHKLPAGKDQIIPDDVTLQMDNEPGTEKLYVVIAKDPLDLATLVKDQENNQTLSGQDGTSVDELTQLLTRFRTNTQVAQLAPPGEKGFTSYKNSSSKPVSYALTEDPSKPMVAVVTLQHYARDSK